MIADRISNLSMTKDVFDNEKQPYEEALQSLGYPETLNCNPPKSKSNKRNRNRKVVWFNPPFSETVKTNVGEKFLRLEDKHFQNTNLDKYFNRKTIKLSYSCLPNLGSIISYRNKNIMKNCENQMDKQKMKCNCRNGVQGCPLER